MAARSESPVTEVVDLRRLAAGSLDIVLEEETRRWREALRWDFAPSAALVKRFVDMQALNGRALLLGGEPIGYTYTVVDEDKGLIGDLYVRQQYATAAIEDELLNATVDTLYRTAGVRRIESQVILLAHPRPAPPTHADQLRLFERCFLVCDLEEPRSWPSGTALGRLDMDGWNERYQDEAAALIAHSYEGHVDAHINDQYRTTMGARRFLQNIVQYPGCGSFFAEGSWLAWHKETGRLCAASLASLVSDDAGHITQICVAPGQRREGIGREILSWSLRSLREAGCRQVSLTVTSSNRNAIALYESMGFKIRRRFAAMVWDQVRPARRFFS
ncbi:MAG TPA: GNAT family N-acetyltransferase [Bryobacteraceae bacterium]|nr:GNAT family N-acetyltransferase [Bryobacteraceae bacterium]